MTTFKGNPRTMSSFDLNGTTQHPHAFIQWKGTDVCMDFWCECGAHCHFDGDFAYTVKCPHCSTVWEMPTVVFPRKAVSPQTDQYRIDNPKMLDPDEDFSA